MKRPRYFAASLAVLLLVTLMPLTGFSENNQESGVIQLYDGSSVRIFGKDFLLSAQARKQLDAVLERYPTNGLRGVTVQFVPKRKDGRDYIDSVRVPINDA